MPNIFIEKLENPKNLPDKRSTTYDGFWIKRSSTYDGIWIQRSTNMPLKYIRMIDPISLQSIQEYTESIWPQGNDFFSTTIWSYAKQMQRLVQIIHNIIFEILSVEHLYESHINSLAYSMKLSEYCNKDATGKKSEPIMPPHVDPNFLSIVCQHKVEGLEVETWDGEWIRVPHNSMTFTVMLGEVFTAWSNGILRAPKHHVRINGTKKHYSVVFNSLSSYASDMVQTPNLLTNDEHPLLFKPFKYSEYMKFCHSKEGGKYDDPLKAFCGTQSN